jgi:hypothetical protein
VKQSLPSVFGFTHEEWFSAFSFDVPEDEAHAKADALFAAHAEHGPDGLMFDHADMLRLSYVSQGCRSKVLAQLEDLGWFGKSLLEKLQHMDQDARASGHLRRSPAADPL